MFQFVTYIGGKEILVITVKLLDGIGARLTFPRAQGLTFQPNAVVMKLFVAVAALEKLDSDSCQFPSTMAHFTCC